MLTAQRLRRLSAASTAFVMVLAACGGGTGTDSDATNPQVTIPAAEAPILSQQPSDAQAVAGGQARFSANSEASNISWAWQLSTDGGSSWVTIANESSNSLTLDGLTFADNNRRYRAVASRDGLQTPSSSALLTVNAQVIEPGISVPLSSPKAVAGGTVSLAITATGTDLQYRWQSSRDGQSWTDLTSANATTLELVNLALDANGTFYRVVVSNSVGSVTSEAIALSVAAATSAPGVTQQPAAVSVIAPKVATFSIIVSGQPAPTLQWQRSTDGGVTFTDIPGATSTRYSTGPTSLSDNGQRVRVTVSNSAGSVFSQAAQLGVTAAEASPAFTLEPDDQRVIAGQTVTFNATASGTPTPTFQWQLSTDGGSKWANINGATSSNYSFTAAAGDNGRRYRLIATNSSGQAQSRDATVSLRSTGPTAVAAGPYRLTVGTPITLNGSGSSSGISGTGGKRLTFAWTVLAAPQGSRANLLNEKSASPIFDTDTAGAYSVQLMVTDVLGATSTAIATITASSTPDCSRIVTDGAASLAQSKSCFACHASDRKLVGPSFKDIAVRYRDTCNATVQLATKIQAGSIGVWGQVPMPANPQVSATEAEALANYILAH